VSQIIIAQEARNFKSLDGAGYNYTGNVGPLTIGRGSGKDNYGHTLFTTFSFGTPVSGKLGKATNLNTGMPIGLSGETNTTSFTILLIKLNND
jgi:hypothetical protein